MIGKVTSVKDNILYCTNVAGYTFVGEVVSFSGMSSDENRDSCRGIVFEINKLYIKILLISGEQYWLSMNDSVHGTNKQVQIKVGFFILGKTVTPFGDIMNVFNNRTDNDMTLFLDTFFQTGYSNISNGSPSIIERTQVRKPLLTGINSVDCLFPVGLGQRQLIIGDHNTGKTSLALTVILNQRFYNSFSKYNYYSYYNFNDFKPCIYVSIGQKRSEVLRIQEMLCDFDSDWYTSIVFSSADDLPIIQYYSPYSACAMGEWFMNKGYDCITVFDDLSKHSVAYRQMTLLLRRAPGREAFPGDVFFLHSKLLERAAQLSPVRGEGSLTSLPVIETLCGDVSSYIPTNVISITDGQLYLNKALVNRGVLPAVDLNLSVSRVGSSAQYFFMREVSKHIKSQIALYRQFKDAELLGASAGHVKAHINRGKRLTLLFTQSLYSTENYFKQTVYFFCLSKGFADDLDVRLTKFFLGSMWNKKFIKYLSKKNSINYMDWFSDLDIAQDSFSVLKSKHFEKKLYKFLFSYKAFFDKFLLPVIENSLDQDYVWSLVNNYNESF